MKDTSLHEFEPAALNQFEAARKLGEMVADNAVSLENAQSTMEFVFAAASKALPNHDPSGLRARLVWHMRDHSNRHWLARIRRERAQEKTLADIAEAAFRVRVQEPEIRQRVADAARSMTPRPPVDVLTAALSLGRWRARQLAGGR